MKDVCQWRICYCTTICKGNVDDSNVLENVSDAGAGKLEAKVDPEGPDHDERSGNSQHSPWRHLIHELCYFKHLKQRGTEQYKARTNCCDPLFYVSNQNGNKIIKKKINNYCNVGIYLQHQRHPDEEHHESIKHTPAVFHIGVIPLRTGTANSKKTAQQRGCEDEVNTNMIIIQGVTCGQVVCVSPSAPPPHSLCQFSLGLKFLVVLFLCFFVFSEVSFFCLVVQLGRALDATAIVLATAICFRFELQ